MASATPSTAMTSSTRVAAPSPSLSSKLSSTAPGDTDLLLSSHERALRLATSVTARSEPSDSQRTTRT